MGVSGHRQGSWAIGTPPSFKIRLAPIALLGPPEGPGNFRIGAKSAKQRASENKSSGSGEWEEAVCLIPVQELFGHTPHIARVAHQEREVLVDIREAHFSEL